MKIISKQEAKSSGLTTYFTGKPCKRGHIAKRWVVSSGCDECMKLNKRKNDHQYYTKNAKKIKQRVKDWTKENESRRKEYMRQYYLDHKDDIKKQALDDYHTNHADRIEQRRQYRKENKDEINRKNVVNVRKRQATKLNATPQWYEHGSIREMYGIPNHDVHHIVPLQECKDMVCGLHCKANLVPLRKEQHLKLHRDRVLLEESWHWEVELFLEL